MVVSILSGKMGILKKIYLTIEGYDLIRRRETVLMGVSGGPDSVCMAHALHELNGMEEFGWNLIVAHINHKLRGPESDEDERFVKTLAKRMGLPFVSIRANVKRLMKLQKLSPEEAARKARFKALRELAVREGAQKILLAHTFDDQAETILFRALRGTGLRGLRGIPSIRMISRKSDLFVVRPLLEVERADVNAYVKDNKLKVRTDPTNRDTAITRNYIRHELLPAIEDRLNPRVKYALVKLGQISRSFYVCMKEISKEIYEGVKLISKEGEVAFSVQEFSKFPPAIQTLVIDKALRKLTGRLPNLSFEHYVGIISLCSTYGHGKVVQLPKGLVAKRQSYVLKIFRPKEETPAPKIPKRKLTVPGKLTVKKLNLTIQSQVLKGKLAGLSDYIRDKDHTEEILDYDRIKFPVSLRLRRSGDVFHPLGSPGRTKLKDFFIDQHVPREYRDRVPLIVDQSGKIVWIVGYRISDDVKVTDKTRKILKLKFQRTDK
jgi:tRNA(Ile)-lysidine synthase